ncbi:hypothetical protein FACS189456_1920 [Bacteroidia bacterium]|nr:hypothetical protein FACS189456_1920 [Bacteroidia bacterium]
MFEQFGISYGENTYNEQKRDGEPFYQGEHHRVRKWCDEREYDCKKQKQIARK